MVSTPYDGVASDISCKDGAIYIFLLQVAQTVIAAGYLHLLGWWKDVLSRVEATYFVNIIFNDENRSFLTTFKTQQPNAYKSLCVFLGKNNQIVGFKDNKCGCIGVRQALIC